MFCPYCGKEVADDAIVCVNCGRGFAEMAQTKTNQDNVEPWSKGVFYGLMAGAIIVPIIGIGSGIYGLFQPEKKRQGLALLITGICAGLFWMAVGGKY